MMWIHVSTSFKIHNACKYHWFKLNLQNLWKIIPSRQICKIYESKLVMWICRFTSLKLIKHVNITDSRRIRKIYGSKFKMPESSWTNTVTRIFSKEFTEKTRRVVEFFICFWERSVTGSNCAMAGSSLRTSRSWVSFYRASFPILFLFVFSRTVEGTFRNLTTINRVTEQMPDTSGAPLEVWSRGASPCPIEYWSMSNPSLGQISPTQNQAGLQSNHPAILWVRFLAIKILINIYYYSSNDEYSSFE